MASRPRRANAGANMQKLLNDAEDEDEFYKENYGGFNEVEDDSDFAQSEKSDDDIVDSDFDLSENEPEPDDEAEEKKLRQEERAVKRKAQVYKDPKVHKPPVRKKKMSDVNNLPKKAATSSAKKPRTSFSIHKPEVRSLRQSTQQTTFDRIERENRAKRKKQRQKNRRPREIEEIVKLTQDELMEEAKKTEIENTLWLEKFKNLEVEKTKRRPKRDFKESKDFTIQQFGYLDKVCDPETDTERSVIRSVISFPTDEKMESFFPKQDTLPDTPPPSVCWVTGQRAKYKDPITGIPYFNVQAYQVIKKLYHRYLEKSPQFRDNDRVKEYLSNASYNSDRLKSFSFGQDAKARYRYDLSQENYEKPVSLNIHPTRSRVNLVGNSLNSANSVTMSQNSMSSGGVTMSQQPMTVSQQSGIDVQQQQQILQFQPVSAQAQRSFTLQNPQALAGFSSPQKSGQQNILQIQNSGNVIAQAILPQQNMLQQKPAQNILQSQQQQQIPGQNILQQQQQPNILQQNPVTKTIQLQPGTQLQTVQIQGSGQQIQTIQIQPAGQLQPGIQAGAQLQLPTQGIQAGTQIQLAGQPSSCPAQQQSQPAQSQTRTVYITAVANNDNAYIIPRQPE